MKKRVFGLLLAVMLCFGMTTSVMATESPEAGEVAVAPVPNMEWNIDGSWAVTLDMAGMNDYEGYSCRYSFTVYRGDELIGMWGSGVMEAMTDVTFSIAHYVVDSGDYKVVVRSYLMDEEFNQIFSEYVETESRTYTRPEAELDSPVVQWDADRTGVLTFNGVEGASGYRCELYQVVDGEGQYCGWIDMELESADTVASVHEADFTDFLWSEGEYYATVVALSADVETIANSAIAESSILNTAEKAEEVEDIVGDANEFEDAAEGLDYLVNNTSKEDLETAMQTNPEVREEIAELEENYASQQGIMIIPPEVTGDAANYVKAEEIDVIGAALNAEAGNEVKISITTPEKTATVTGNYSKLVQLDLKLLCDGQSVSELTVPVTITMPVPTGISTANLRILHYHDGATEGKTVNYSLSADGKYITFTVDSFSTFVFANQVVQNSTTNPGTTVTAPVSPKTGDNGMGWMAGMFALALAGVVVARKRSF